MASMKKHGLQDKDGLGDYMLVLQKANQAAAISRSSSSSSSSNSCNNSNSSSSSSSSSNSSSSSSKPISLIVNRNDAPCRVVSIRVT